MGNNFLSKVAKPFKKRWEEELKNLKAPDLFSSPLEKPLMTLKFKPEKGCKFEPEQTCIVYLKEGELRAYFNNQLIGRCLCPSPSLLKEVAEQQGQAAGKIICVYPLTQQADISIEML